MLIRLGMRDLTLNTCTLENGWYAEVNSFQYLDAIWMRGETGGLEIGQCWALFQFELDEKFFFFFYVISIDREFGCCWRNFYFILLRSRN